MSGDVEHPAQCEAIADELTELALGTLSGHRRSEILDHVDSCQGCRAELEQLSIVVEALQEMAPRVQPPVGFELRLAERLRKSATPRSRSRRVGVLGAAAVALVALAVGVSALALRGTGNGTDSAPADLRAANFTSHEHVVGELFVAPGSPAWMFVTIHDSGWHGTVNCDVTLSGGRVARVGTFKLAGEYGSWAVRLPTDGGQVRSARLVAADGTIVASAVWET